MAASSLIDGCRYNPTLGGTTDWTYSSAVQGYNSPALAGVVNGAQYSYHAESADLSQWEDGIGLYNTGTGVLTRATVLYNSAGTGTASGQSGAGTKISFTVAPQAVLVCGWLQGQRWHCKFDQRDGEHGARERDAHPNAFDPSAIVRGYQLYLHDGRGAGQPF
jgi:hypothetical protein